MRRPSLALSLCFGIAAFSSAPSSALPPNFLDQPIAASWDQAVGLTFAPDGRMFVWEKAGRVWIVENGVKAATPLIDISDEVGNWRDYGLLGFAIDPGFYGNGYIYLLYVVDYHHLIYYGTPSYDPQADTYFQDTIARLTRYACNAADGYRSVDYGSRTILIGESISAGFPIAHQSHGIGTLCFGRDGTLLASCGDGASYETTDTGGPVGGSSNTALADGIITAAEDVGAFRAQLLDSLDGKVVRIDPATGDGVPTNPFYAAGDPRAARSRTWALGLRNPFRFTLRPGTGSADPADGDPGVLYIGDVGWNDWEELDVCTQAGQNFGWPLYEGMWEMSSYYSADVANRNAVNPLFGTTPPGQGFCAQQYFRFRDLVIQDTLDPSPSFPNPCDPNAQVPANVPHFIHRRPAIDWFHSGSPSRTGIFVGNDAGVVNIGDPGSPVSGPQFGGFCAVGGAWYTGTSYPVEYQNTYFHADFAMGWMRQFIFDGGDRPVEVRDFAPEGTAAFVGVAADPVSGDLFYVNYAGAGGSSVRRISYVQNIPPVAVVSANPNYGPAPLLVQFDASASYDPDGLAEDLTYIWDFGDGSALVGGPTAEHTYPISDVTAQGTFVGRIFSLNPPHPIGGGNWDPEVMRDGDYPPVGNQDSARQYDTYHAGGQGDIDWIGYSFVQSRTFVGLTFQEGKHFFDGGWFDLLRVQVRQTGVWSDVGGLTIAPPYPGNNGVTYETFDIRFDPVAGDGVRLYGNPGGSANFISVGELRAWAQPEPPVTGPTRYDATVTVRDALGAFSSALMIISLNNTPPVVTITSPEDGSLYPLIGETFVPLTADISDAEHGLGELTCRWQTILHHNDHAHPEPFDYNCTSVTQISPVGCDGQTYYYEIVLRVDDPAGLYAQRSSYIYPDCSPSYGDFDLDYDIDLVDFAFLQRCDGPAPIAPECVIADSDANGAIDLADFAAFSATFTGPRVPHQ